MYACIFFTLNREGKRSFIEIFLIDHRRILGNKKKTSSDKSPMILPRRISITQGRRENVQALKSSLPFPIEIKDQFNPLSPSKFIHYSINLFFSSFNDRMLIIIQ